MEHLNSNSSKILSYINALETSRDTAEDISHYPGNPREHNGRRLACIGKLTEVVKHVLSVTALPKITYTFNKMFINFFKKPAMANDLHSSVRLECRNILVYLTCIADPEQIPADRAIAAHECVHSLEYIVKHVSTDALFAPEFVEYITALFNDLTGCLEQTPGHLLIPSRELHIYSRVFPTGVHMSRISSVEFTNGYDLNVTATEKISKWDADLLRCADLLQCSSPGDPYRWLSWSFVVAKGDEFKGTWAGCAIVETLKKVCSPEHVASGIAASRSALEYVSATQQGRAILEPLERSTVTPSMAMSLCESRIDPTGGRWPAYRQQGARNFDILADFIDTTNLAKQLPVKFVYSSRMCRIATTTVNSVSNYITDHVPPDNEIVLKTLLAEGWLGTVESLVNAVNSL